MKDDIPLLPVAVIGAGPVGLAAAAHLIQVGKTPLILEAAGMVAANLASYQQVKLFSPWRYNLDRAATALLKQEGWQQPDLAALPTAGQMINDYLQPLADLSSIKPHLKLNHRVLAITRQGYDKVKTKGREMAAFVLRVETPEGEREFLASAVIDASGTWSQANPMGANGLAALGESQLSQYISYGMPDILGADRQRYAHKRVLVVGSGHSAAGNLLALAQLAEQAPSTTLLWAIRGKQTAKTFGGGSADGLAARGQLGTRLKALQESGRLELHSDFQIREIRSDSKGLQVIAESREAAIQVDEIIVSTGARPNLEITRELRVRHDDWLESTDALAPLIDPNEHSCGTVRPHGYRELSHPEANYYAVGAKSYGRAPNFLMATGYEQVRSVVAALAGDMAAANDVQLELPETGVCSTQPQKEETECCGGSTPVGSDACCKLDAEEKTKGKVGCRCHADVAPPPKKSCCA